MSYSLYLWHWSILSLSRWTVGIQWWSTPIELGAILGFAALSYKFIERPLRRVPWSKRKLGTLAYGLIAVGCSAGAINYLKKGAFYTGTPVKMAAKGVETLMDDKGFGTQIQWSARDCVLSSDNDVGKKISADRCTLGTSVAAGRRRFLVIGNSFSAAEFEMYSALSEAGLGSVVATSSWGASPVPEIPNNSPWAKANAYYWNNVVPRLISLLGVGDFVIMINDLSNLTPAVTNPEPRISLLGLAKDWND